VANSTSGEHVYVINYVHSQLASDPKYVREAKDYKNKMNQLKHLRVMSDYHEVEIHSDKATKAVTYRDDILNIITTIFL
jgi:hypothetical protein